MEMCPEIVGFLKVRGYTYTTTGEELLETTGEVFANVEACVLWVQVNHTHPLSQAAQAHVDLEGRKTSGSIVLIP
ncbi:hypothetical protein FEM48_Zijuj11G0070600 [Ziziphus jujuba var. spinosa]|uniref:Uncharacterized protein n=1 Tax=Ziziphus jujuba var. spinosa TaxID=714518 RepID=A0A978UHI6_ZIZJJ|nr:hypothetical protein FEM48_Zijuj11G0070600 [Ziziphus jujuba var. spinosa]